jgi:hypothetical protein
VEGRGKALEFDIFNEGANKFLDVEGGVGSLGFDAIMQNSSNSRKECTGWEVVSTKIKKGITFVYLQQPRI